MAGINNGQYNWWYISKLSYEAKWIPILKARQAVINKALEINRKIQEGKDS